MDPDADWVLDEVGGGGAHGHVGVASCGLRGRVLDVLENHFVTLSSLLLLSQAVFTQLHVHNRALDTNGEAALPEVRGTLLSIATTGFKSNTVRKPSHIRAAQRRVA